MFLSSAILETKTLPEGQKQTIMRCVVHSMPPVKAIAEPNGRISEAFLSSLCRCSDFFDEVTRKELRQRHQIEKHRNIDAQQRRESILKNIKK